MNHTFDKSYWDDIWSSERAGSMSTSDPNPHLIRQVEALRPGSAIDAGCGAGAEAIWLTGAGWAVTAADVAAGALAFGEQRAADAGLSDRIQWVQADLSSWEPNQQYDLVTTHYAHPAIGQLEFYRRIATWVAPKGTLLIVGHLHRHDDAEDHDHGQRQGQGHSHGHGHGHGSDEDSEHEGRPPTEASTTAAAITELLDGDIWEIETAEEPQRTMTGPGGRVTTIHDVVVRATRRN
ncbi:class I SAM-dependent methyltransferase [Nocardioides carbamazepini]|uniref:SAM-dependent methyltransferase n=1 Tax=Nocardioides carbamazepini TaxID=2854259 RepID=UPI002149AB91|nr:class I SAM-dependent methyltransferase [Nocardioides carbamazepini]MCR1785934.1 class I SAM-dependent methyltransferase [Nocardioides carbamazepini]